MNKLILVIVLISLISCTKKNLTENSKDDGSLTGKWKLVATQFYNVNFGDSSWKNADLLHHVTIEFTADSTFNYSSNFPWNGDKYDRYKKSDNSLFIYRSVIVNPLIWTPDIFIEQTNKDEIILIRHFVDTGEKEKYVKAN